ncbi:hypothetical protein BT69DRAFT_410754 [Atractiella rhizophila]|nr:hypothetical protein BT69DRAFT_410754 [Atractiella rhizophila]
MNLLRPPCRLLLRPPYAFRSRPLSFNTQPEPPIPPPPESLSESRRLDKQDFDDNIPTEDVTVERPPEEPEVLKVGEEEPLNKLTIPVKLPQLPEEGVRVPFDTWK